MQIKEVMSREVAVIYPDTSIAEAAEIMKTQDIGMLPVCDGQNLVGMLTDRDIVVRGTADGTHPEVTQARELMTPEVVYCFEDQEVEEAGGIMQEKQIRRLPIVDRKKRLVGVLSLGDVAVRTRDQELSGDVLQEVSEPAAPKPMPGQKRQ